MTLHSSPYSPPETPISAPSSSTDLASRASRLAAALIDALVSLVLLVPLMVSMGLFEGFPNVAPISKSTEAGLGILGFLIFLALHGRLLETSGQTIGKRLVGIRMVQLDGRPATFTQLVGRRYLPLAIIAHLPLGGFLSLVDAVSVFAGDRRCIHDRIAGTKVVRVDV